MQANGREREVLDWLAAQYPAMVELLEELVNIDSGSYDKEGVDKVAARLRRHLDERGIATRVIETKPVSGQRRGDCFEASIPGRPGGSNDHVVLLGHCDTVFPKGEAGRRPFRIEGNRAYGPGVADMKAGLVMNTFMLEAIMRHGGGPNPLIALYTADEEIASGASREVIEQVARGARAVFNAEPSYPSGNVLSGHKGAMFLTIEAKGVPAHSGVAPEKGRSAIEALCRKVSALHALTDFESGTTTNVGLIEGGVSVNTVAPSARCRLDVRFKTHAEMAKVEQAIALIVEKTEIEGTSASIIERSTFLPLEPAPPHDRLFAHYQSAAAELGLSIEREYTGGSTDSGFTASIGAPSLCGTGPGGEMLHQPEEICHIDALIPRAQALALAILRLGS